LQDEDDKDEQLQDEDDKDDQLQDGRLRMTRMSSCRM
jgi:hypothetical protein